VISVTTGSINGVPAQIDITLTLDGSRRHRQRKQRAPTSRDRVRREEQVGSAGGDLFQCRLVENLYRAPAKLDQPACL
jgi:hypothetical protein